MLKIQKANQLRNKISIGLILVCSALTLLLVAAEVVQARGTKEASLLEMQSALNNFWVFGITLAIKGKKEASLLEIQGLLNALWVFGITLAIGGLNLGFGLREIGLCRQKNAVNALSKTILVMTLVALVYWAIGFSFMFAKGGNNFIGLGGWFLSNDNPQVYGLKAWPVGLSLSLFFLFQMILAGIPALIVSGALAERIKFLDFLLFSLVLGGVIYPITGHWLKGEGWLAQMGFRDFAGSTLIYGVGGWSALVGVSLLGPRQGRYFQSKVWKIPGFSPIWAGVGTLMITLAGICAVAGATLKFTEGVGEIALKTYLAALVSGVAAILLSWFRKGQVDFNRLLSGLIGGVVAIAAGCQEVSLVGAVLIGTIAGVLTVYGVGLLDRLHLDDPTETISIYLFCGIWGTLAVGLLSPRGGLIVGETKLLVVQLIGIASVGLLAIIGTTITLLSLKWTLGLRVSLEREINGLDQDVHGIDPKNQSK